MIIKIDIEEGIEVNKAMSCAWCALDIGRDYIPKSSDKVGSVHAKYVKSRPGNIFIDVRRKK